MRLLIVGTLKGQLTAATKIAMDRGAAVTHAESIEQAMAVLRSGKGADLLMVEVAVDIRALVEKLELEHIHVLDRGIRVRLAQSQLHSLRGAEVAGPDGCGQDKHLGRHGGDWTDNRARSQSGQRNVPSCYVVCIDNASDRDYRANRALPRVVTPCRLF